MAATAASHFTAARTLLRSLLGELQGQDPASLHFQANAYGKPSLAGMAGPRFNVSHSGGHVLVAIDWRHEIGIDIEYPLKTKNWRRIAPMVCSAMEIQMWERLDSEAALLRLWTQKEAIAKTLGLGFSASRRNIPAMPENPEGWRMATIPAMRGQTETDIAIIEIDLQPGLYCHLASAGPAGPIHLLRLT